MRIPTVQKCCCFLDLKIAVFVISAVISFVNIWLIIKGIESSSALWIIPNVISLLVCAAVDFGVIKKKEIALLPFLVLFPLAILTLIIYPFVSDEKIHAENYGKPGYDFSTLLVMVLFYWTIAGIASYFWLIVYSLYTFIKDESSGNFSMP